LCSHEQAQRVQQDPDADEDERHREQADQHLARQRPVADPEAARAFAVRPHEPHHQRDHEQRVRNRQGEDEREREMASRVDRRPPGQFQDGPDRELSRYARAQQDFEERDDSDAAFDWLRPPGIHRRARVDGSRHAGAGCCVRNRIGQAPHSTALLDRVKMTG
jgi:hypothetical protein